MKILNIETNETRGNNFQNNALRFLVVMVLVVILDI